MDGKVSEALRAEILASDAPAHARARRLLAAMDEPVDVAPAPAPAGEDGAPALRAPPLGHAPVDPVPAAEPGPVPPKMSPAANPATSPPPAAPKASAGKIVSSVGLKATKAGATLTLRGRGKLMVGSVNQLASGRIHLVIDQASAAAGVTSARPTAGGVRVTSVRQGAATVQISLQLEAGWTLGSIDPFSGGTRVKFRRS